MINGKEIANGTPGKIRVLAYCDSPTCATGFATVSRNVLMGLYNTGRYSIDVIGINYWGDPHNFPFRIWPAGTNAENDPYGRKKAFDMIHKMEYDVLFFLQDTFILDFLPQLHESLRMAGKNFRSVCYFPVDGVPIKEWLHNVNACDHIVAYTDYGRNTAKEAFPEMKDLQVIPHGVNIRDFYPMGEKDITSFRAQFFGACGKNFIFTNLNRNQQRKDIPRTIAAFAELKKEIKDITLYLHMAVKDQGWELDRIVANYGLRINSDVIFPQNFGPNQGFPRHVVNMIYNASDCVVSTTLGEGFGLSWIEAMATKTPIIMPDNTAMTEFITPDRGYLVKSGNTNNLYTICRNDNDVVRPLTDIDDLVDKMRTVYWNRQEAKAKAEKAYSWVTTQMDWQSCVVPKWVNLFDAAYDNLQKGVHVPVGKQDVVIETEAF